MNVLFDNLISNGDPDAVFARMQAQLLEARNRAWIPVILGAQSRGTIVVAAGAAHLHGDAGVLNLLAEQGYTLTRQPF